MICNICDFNLFFPINNWRAGWTSTMGGYCQNCKIQGTCSIWCRLVLRESWLVYLFSSLISMYSYKINKTNIILLLSFRMFRLFYSYNRHFKLIQHPWQGRSTWEEVLVLEHSSGFTMEARGTEVALHTSVKAVEPLFATFYNNCRRWTLLMWTQRVERELLQVADEISIKLLPYCCCPLIDQLPLLLN